MKIIRWLVLSLLFVSCGCSVSGNATGTLPRTVPVTRFYMIDGGVLTTPELKGKTAVIGFWASNCRHSASGMSDFNQLAWRYRNKDVVFLGVSIDKQENFGDVKKRISERDWTSMQHAFSGNDVYDEAWITFGGDRVPYFFLINDGGKIVAEGSNVGDIEKGLKTFRR